MCVPGFAWLNKEQSELDCLSHNTLSCLRGRPTLRGFSRSQASGKTFSRSQASGKKNIVIETSRGTSFSSQALGRSMTWPWSCCYPYIGRSDTCEFIEKTVSTCCPGHFYIFKIPGLRKNIFLFLNFMQGLSALLECKLSAVVNCRHILCFSMNHFK